MWPGRRAAGSTWPATSPTWTARPMVDARRLRADLLAFAAAIGWPVTVAQAAAMDVFGRPQRETAVVGPRRSGKTRSAAVCALSHCFCGRGHHALVISAAEDRAKDVRALAAGIARDSPLLAGSVADVQTQRLTLSTGSTMRCVAATDAAVRGNFAQLVIADEAS